MTYPFLSADWLDEARRIRAELSGEGPAVVQVLRMNLVVTEVPFGEGQVAAHLDTSEGQLEIEVGHVEEPDLSVTVDYVTAKAILVEGNAQAGMQAFMAGKVRVEGDMAKLLALQTVSPDPAGVELAHRLRSITD